MQHAAADEEYRDCRSYPNHPQRLERGLSAGFGSIGGWCDKGGYKIKFLAPVGVKIGKACMCLV